MKIAKSLLLFFLIVIPTILILYNIFVGFIGYYFIVNNNDVVLYTLLEKEKIDYTKSKIIFVDTTTIDDDHMIIINKNLSIKEKWIHNDEKNELIDYVKTNGIDVYNVITVLNYIYVIVIASIVFFKKLLENVDKFGKFEERDN